MISKISCLPRLFWITTFCILTSASSWAQEYVIESKSASEALSYDVTIVSNSEDQQELILTTPESEVIKFPLDSLLLSDHKILVLKNASEKASFLTQLNCSENEFNATFTPILSGMVTMLDTLSQATGKELTLEVRPATVEKSKGFSWWSALIGLGLGAIIGIGASRISKPKENTLKVDSEVIENKQEDKWAYFLKDLMDITKQDYENAGSMQDAVKNKYQNLQSQLSHLDNQLLEVKQSEKHDELYFQNLNKIYLQVIQNYFSKNVYADDIAPQRTLLENLLPLALHYDSYIKIRQRRAMDSDKLNYNNIYKGGGQLQNLPSYPYETDYVSNSPMVASIIAIMKHYGIDDLKEVNYANKRIAK